MSQENYITIRNYSDHIVADIARAALHTEGIETFAFVESHSMLPAENVEIKVKESEVQTALDILSIHESKD